MNDYIVYSLTCPFTYESKYIGITNNVDRRMVEHLTTAVVAMRSPLYRARLLDLWLVKLASYGYIPDVDIIADGLTRHDALTIEKEMIVGLGMSLYNESGNMPRVSGSTVHAVEATISTARSMITNGQTVQ